MSSRRVCRAGPRPTPRSGFIRLRRHSTPVGLPDFANVPLAIGFTRLAYFSDGFTKNGVNKVAMTLPELRNPDQYALFLDFDGTLVAIADRPEDVRLDPETRDALAELNERLAGALAIVTGREIAAVDRFLEPLRLSVAGLHRLMPPDSQRHT